MIIVHHIHQVMFQAGAVFVQMLQTPLLVLYRVATTTLYWMMRMTTTLCQKR
jgi:hypothetical protein